MKKYDIYKMREMKLEGVTMAFIGRKYSLTRERVRQILFENFGKALSSARNLKEYVRNEVMEYQWDSGNNKKEAQNISNRIMAAIQPIKFHKNDPLKVLIKK